MDTVNTPRFLSDDELFPVNVAKPLSYFVTVAIIVFVYFLQKPKLNTPLINSGGAFSLTSSWARKRFNDGARELIYSWFEANPKKCVRMISDVGELMLLPPSMANEIRNDSRLSFFATGIKFFHTSIPGYEAFKEGIRDNTSLKVINKDLNKSPITEPLVNETTLAMKDLFTEKKDWHAIPLRSTMTHLIARVSSCIFLGTEIGRNEEWLTTTKEYSMTVFDSAPRLRQWPHALLPLVHWFLPGPRKLRALRTKATKMIQPVINERRVVKAAAVREGRNPPKFNDAIEWFEQESNGSDYNPALCQLFLAMVSIHTTTDLFDQVLIDIACHPEVIEPLRKEVIESLSEHGWNKDTLPSMKLLDSLIKESQRLKPLQLMSMQRIAQADIILSDGTFIPKGQFVSVSSHNFFDADIYENPEKWDPYRFYHMREQPGKENSSLLVGTSPEHLGFGHGVHACPGRFFAANEIKIMLVYMLLHYEWRLPTGVKPTVTDIGVIPTTDPFLKMEIRRRSEEVIF